MTVDPYVDPRTGVLRNLLGLTDAAGLAQAEARLAAAAEVVLFAEHLDLGHYDLPHLRAIHRHLFRAIYDWAGELRTVNMTKGDTVFALVEWLEPQAEQVFAWLADEHHLLNRPRDQFIEGASRSLSDLNAPIRSARAMAAPSVRSSGCWPLTAAGTSPGLRSTRLRMRPSPPLPWPIAERSSRCSTGSSARSLEGLVVTLWRNTPERSLASGHIAGVSTFGSPSAPAWERR